MREEEDNEEDGGPLPADAVEMILCSIQCVMAASSWSSQSEHSCPPAEPPSAGDEEGEASRGSC